MTTATITIPVDDDTARAYAEASEQDKKKMELLVRLQLKDYISKPQRSLNEIMDDISREAAARGLTPEILESILKDE
jgi:hypothetical protein